METLPGTTRTLTAPYDPLRQLTGMTDDSGPDQTYAYDAAGNRTEVREDGAPVVNLSYNDANQVIGWSYDAAGNLLSDGTTTRSDDALNRLVAHDSTSYTDNGDGVLVSDGTTTYAQDLAAPLSQVLSDGTDTYVYGQERLRALGGPWYVGDALGSVRQTLDDAGGVRTTTNYDPWGTPQGSLSAPFGFTGELHHGGQVYLRARWYAPGQGRFVSEDPFAGFPELPYSLHAYQYAYSNPVRWTDPTGAFPTKEGIDQGGYTYSCNCGWIDWGHANPGNIAKAVIEKVNEAIDFFENPINACHEYFFVDPTAIDHRSSAPLIGSVQTTHNAVVLRRGKVTQANRHEVAMGIFRWVEENIEDLQFIANPGNYSRPFSQHPANSGYAEEDLSSDLLAFYGYLEGYTSSDIDKEGGKRFRKYIRNHCDFDEDAEEARTWSLDVYRTYGNFTQVFQWERPRLHATPCIDKYCGGKIRAWPTEFTTVQPAPGGLGDFYYRSTYGIFKLRVRAGDEDKAWLVIDPRKVR